MVYIVLLLLSLISHIHWFANLSILVYGDWYYQFPETMIEFLSLPQVWSATGLGNVNISLSFFPFQLLYGLLTYFHFTYGLIERIVFLWPIALVCPLSSFFLVRKYTKNTIAAVIGSIVYTYNTYFFSIKTGHLTLMASYAFAPLALLFFQKTLQERKIFYGVLTGLLLFICGFYEFRALYLLVWILFFYYLYFQLIIEKSLKKNIFINAYYAFIPILLLGLLNLYWVLPFSRLGTIATNDFFGRTLFGNEFLNITNAFSLFHPFWTGGRPTEFITMPIPIYFWLVPVFAMMGLFLQRKSKHILFFGLVSFLGILLTKQVGLPFSGLYEWMYLHFPGFNAYREASKFFFIVALGYSVLIGGTIDWLYTNYRKEKQQRYLVYGVTMLVALLFLWNAKPAITGELGTLFVPRHIPEDYVHLKDVIIKQPGFFRTLWVPAYSRWSIYTNNHPELSAIDQINGSWRIFIKNEAKDEKNTEADLVIKLLQKPVGNMLLDTASIKYVFIPLQDYANDDNFFRYYEKDRAFYVKSLDNIPYLKRVNMGLKNVVVYENDEFKPHLFLSNSSSEEKASLSSQFINPSEYNIVLSHVTNPINFQFSESYHPKWKLHVGDFDWINAVTDKNYFLPDKDHTKDLEGLNSYYLDPRTICQTQNCKKNPDGSYDIEMTLFFQPQAYGYIGNSISGVTLIIIVIYLIFYAVKERRNGKK